MTEGDDAGQYITTCIAHHKPPEASRSFVLPAGVIAWDQLLRDGKTAAPWPYSSEQWDRIRQLGALTDWGLQAAVLLAARRYCFVEHLLKRRPIAQKSGDELAALRGAIASLRSALEALGDGAFDHLAAYRSGGPSGSLRREPQAVAAARNTARDHFRKVRAPELVQESLTGIEWALDRFERDNAQALANLPANRQGRPPRIHEKWLYRKLLAVFHLSHPGKKQPRGSRKFFRECALPLGWRDRSDEALEELARSGQRRAKSRANSAENSRLNRAT